MIKKLVIITFLISAFSAFSQEVELKGVVYDEYLEPFPNAIVRLSTGKTTTSNFAGTFSIKTELPVTIVVTSIGFSSETLEVTSKDDQVSLILKENSGLEQIILSASRTPERLFESPVSVERISLNDIRKTPSVSFYESLENLKNVDVKMNSILLKSVNTKGFSGLENIRFVQLIDGVDNVYPSAALSPGNMLGLVDMDVENVEILEGASSALYGANAFNGVMLIKSKNPFNYEGVSVKLQSGVTSQNSGNDMFYHPSVRMGYKFSDYFAAKASFDFYSGKEWRAEDYRNTNSGEIIEGTDGRTGEYYNGLNVFGDEYALNQKTIPFIESMLYGLQATFTPPGVEKNKLLEKVAIAKSLLSVVDNVDVTRNGYKEGDLTDYNVKNLKFNTSLHYRPFANEKLELIWTSRFTEATSLFNFGVSKFAMNNAKLNQNIIEVKGESFFLRGFSTIVDAGDSYNLNALGSILNESAYSSGLWYQNYLGALLLPGSNAQTARENSNLGRNDGLIAKKYDGPGLNSGVKRFEPGTNRFNRQVEKIKSIYIKDEGAKFHDNSKMYNAEGNFNFSKYIDWAEIQIGGSYRRTVLNSYGILSQTIYELINVDDYGAYTQIRKNLLDDRMKITISGRYDKTKNFDRMISPRASISYTTGENRSHNFRLSAQTAFRQPTVQEQYGLLDNGGNFFTLGNTEESLNRLKKEFKLKDGSKVIVDRDFLLNRTGFTKKSFDSFYSELINNLDKADDFGIIAVKTRDLFNKNILQTTKIQENLKPEEVRSYEVGYRGMVNLTPTNILELDVNGYFNRHKNFIRYQDLYIPLSPNANAGASKNFNGGVINPLDVLTNPFALACLNVIGGDRVQIAIPKNLETRIDAFGFGVGVKTRIWGNYKIGANYSWNDYTYQKNVVKDFQPDFNTSRHNVKILLGNENVLSNLGFTIAARWQSGYYWYSDFGLGNIDARTVIDGQITYNVPVMKSKFRVGGTNLSGKPYYDTLGNGKVGSIYYFSWIIND